MGSAGIGLRSWLAVPAALIGLVAGHSPSDRPSVQGLVGQLEGGQYRFRAEGDSCRQRRPVAFPASVLTWLLERDDA